MQNTQVGTGHIGRKEGRKMGDKSFVYIMSNKSRSVLYVGVTSNLEKRVHEHKQHVVKSAFSNKYNCIYLVYFEEFADIEAAIAREKQLKGWKRAKKDALIAKMNPGMKDLSTFAEDEQQQHP